MIRERFVCGRTRSNTYLLGLREGGDCVLVDAGPGVTHRVRHRIEALDLTLVAILLTHGHPDHVWCANTLSRLHDVEVWLHPADRPWLDDPATGGRIPVLRQGGRILAGVKRLRPARLRPVEHGSAHVAGLDVAVLHTPGHTPGSVCYRAGELLFTGDTVFANGPGHTGYPGGDRRTLRRSARDRLVGLPDDLRVLPGHGPETTMASVRGWLEPFAVD